MSTTYFPARRIPALPSTLNEKYLRWAAFALVALVVGVMLFYPELAFAQDAKARIEAAGKKTYDLIFSIAYWLCAAAVVGVGFTAMSGRMEWSRAGYVALGVTIVFSALLLVDYFKF